MYDGDASATREEAARSGRRWGVDRFDLLQVHNLLAWQGHLETLKAMKAEGQVRYIGITTSHGRRHCELAQIMEREPIDSVQLTYSVLDREAENPYPVGLRKPESATGPSFFSSISFPIRQ